MDAERENQSFNNTVDSLPILIVGAGPSGLSLALTLLQNGVPVRVIDKAVSPPKGQRGAGIMPRTLEIYEFLGVLSDILKTGHQIPPCTQHELPGGTKVIKQFDMVTMYDPTPDCPHLRAYMLGQDEVIRILRSHLAKYGCEVEYGVELVSFEQGPNAVTVQVSAAKDGNTQPGIIEARYLVGADGGRGIVRKQLGLTFLGETRTEDGQIIADVPITGLGKERWHMWGDIVTKFVMIRPTETEGIFWILSGGRQVDCEKIVSDPESLKQFIRDVSNRSDFELGDFITLTSFRPNIRMVNKFGEGRVFVAGDAAHVHTPLGAQGSNSGVMDSFNLGWKLVLVYKGLAPSSLLSTYTEERLPVIAQMLNKTTELLDRTVAAAANKVDIKPEDLQNEDQNPWVRGKVLFQLGVNYRWSSIVLDEKADAESNGEESRLRAYGSATGASGDRVYAGDRAPDVPFLADLKQARNAVGPGMKRLFEFLKPTHHTVLIFSTTVDAALEVLEQLPHLVARSMIILPTRTPVESLVPRENWKSAHYVVKDCYGYAYKHYSANLNSLKVIVIRPDGVVGAIVGGTQGVKEYFSRVFAIKH